MKLEKAKSEMAKYREKHLSLVEREKGTFTKWYDKAAQSVFDGSTKQETIDLYAPWGCDKTQCNGVLAGALQASRLINAEKEPAQ